MIDNEVPGRFSELEGTPSSLVELTPLPILSQPTMASDSLPSQQREDQSDDSLDLFVKPQAMMRVIGKPFGTSTVSCIHDCSRKSKFKHHSRFHYDYLHRKAFKNSFASRKFLMGRRIGNGAFGMIFEGLCLVSRLKVAIKVEFK